MFVPQLTCLLLKLHQPTPLDLLSLLVNEMESLDGHRKAKMVKKLERLFGNKLRRRRSTMQQKLTQGVKRSSSNPENGFGCIEESKDFHLIGI